MVGRVGRKNHRGKNIFYEPTMGISPLTVLGKMPGHDFEILWEPVAEIGCQPMSQLVFIAKDGKSFQLPFRRGEITADQIREMLKAREVAADQIVAISNSDDEAAEMKALTDELAPKGKEGEIAPLVNGVEVDAEMRAAISPDYRGPLPKLDFTVSCSTFLSFRVWNLNSTISKGSSTKERPTAKSLSRRPNHFLREFQQGGRMARWGHILSAEWSERGIEARMQFFAGPRVQPIVWRVLIGKNPLRIIYHQSTGYAFLYFEDMNNEFQGERIELTALERIIIPAAPPILRIFRR